VAKAYRQDVYVLADPRQHFGFRDAIGGVVITGAGEVIGARWSTAPAVGSAAGTGARA
jgi:hypothetical protein